MISSKLEKCLFVFVCYLLLILFRFILPISTPPSNIDKYVVVLLSVMATLIIYRIYIYYRNKHILKNINLLLEANQLEESIIYINKCLIKQKECRSLHMYRLYVVGMCGRITEFEKMLSEYERSHKYQKLIKLDFVEGLKGIFNFFKTYTCTDLCSKQQYWVEITNALAEKELKKHMPVLISAYHSANYSIFKAVFSLKLYLSYFELNDDEKAKYYYNEALKHAPSLEIAYYIENARNTTQGNGTI